MLPAPHSYPPTSRHRSNHSSDSDKESKPYNDSATTSHYSKTRFLPVNPLTPKLGDLGNFWNLYDAATEAYDNDMLTALKSNVESLLIFVSLGHTVA